MIAMSKAGSTCHQRLHALNLTTGAEEFRWSGGYSSNYPKNRRYFHVRPKQYKDRAALLLWGGIVYISFGSHCDISPSNGWIMGYNENTLSRVTALNLTPNGNLGTIWQVRRGTCDRHK